jgi:hypothetical protein
MVVARVHLALRVLAAATVGMVVTAALILFQSSELILLESAPFAIPSPIPAQDIKKNAHDNIRPGQPKYFVEPGGSYNRMHYDLRYFHKELEAVEHRLVLEDLVRSYLNVTNHYEIETWLAHGTLMGWWWGERILPWDADLDFQVSHETLHHLATSMNFTEFRYSFQRPDGQEVSKTYLLDINPHYIEKDRGDGQNIIDARWIDTDNGLYVDITSVRERNFPGVWSCKDGHRYDEPDLWPLMETVFEGIRAFVPSKSTDLLRAEYGAESTSREQFSGYVAYFG